jgi:uncharacterized LabA/DUF88 family protein
MPEDTLRLAVLIDADNSSVTVLADILAEASKLGTATVKRVYGDFTSTNLQGWGKVLAEHAVQPIQQYRNTTKKNASDSALIIDAMDLLHTNRFDGFCLVSSDSDFTRLAIRIREDGLPVFGFGEEKTPNSFVKACNRFFYIEIFKTQLVEPEPEDIQGLNTTQPDDNALARASATVSAHKTEIPLRDLKTDTEFKQALDKAIDAASPNDANRAELGAIGTHLQKLMPEFDSRNYGFKKLSDLVEKIGTLQVSRIGNTGGPQRIYVQRR